MIENPLLTIRNLTKTFGACEILKGVSFQLARGECVAIIGPSGSGKSTCLRAINFLEPPTSGDIVLAGHLVGRHAGGKRMNDRELAPHRAEMGMVFQHFNLWPHLCVRDNVALQPRMVRGLSRNRAIAIAEESLAKVHMTDKLGAMPQQLSGGQQQRVAIARALAQQPKVMLFDEPTSALDPELIGEVLGVIRELADDGLSMIIVTHEIAFAREVADRILFMDAGQIVEQGRPAPVLDRPHHPRLKRFLSALAQGA